LIVVPPNGSADYEVTYLPLTMTANPEVPSIKEESHNATLFFPIPVNYQLYIYFNYF
jgi:hypothetical protein